MSTRERISSRSGAPNPAISRSPARPGSRAAPTSRPGSRLPQDGHGGPAPALGEGARPMLGDQGMSAPQLFDGAPPCSRPLAVDDAHRAAPGEERVVEGCLEQVAGLVGGLPDQVELAGHAAFAAPIAAPLRRSALGPGGSGPVSGEGHDLERLERYLD